MNPAFGDEWRVAGEPVLLDALGHAAPVRTPLVDVEVEPDADRPTHEVVFRHKAPGPAVVAAIPVIAHYEIMSGRDFPLIAA